MPMKLDSDSYKYMAVALMLLAILFGYLKGRGADAASRSSRRWTRVPLIAFAIVVLGPSALAVLIYLGYSAGVLQPPASGYRFTSFIQDLPLDFAVINWPFVALYLIGRLRPNAVAIRAAMWGAVVAMALPNILLFCLASTMVSNVYDAGQGIGVIESVVMMPILAMIWPAPMPGFLDSEMVAALTGPVPILGLMGWFVGRLMGWAGHQDGEQLCGS